MKEKIQGILSHWGLQSSKIEQIYSTVWQVEDAYVLKVYTKEDVLKKNVRMLQILYEKGIPVSEVVPMLDGRVYAEAVGAYYVLTKKLSGSRITRINEELAYVMGGVIADLHTVFEECEKEGEFQENSLLEEMNGWVKESLENSGWKYFSKEEYEAVVSKLTAVYNALPVQLIHRDVHFGNFLFDDGNFSGYIDFDLSQRNIRIFDLCYFLLGLLADDDMAVAKEEWFALVEKAFCGYQQKMLLSYVEKQAVIYVMECIELLFVAYFEKEKQELFAKSAFRILAFVKENEERIRLSV